MIVSPSGSDDQTVINEALEAAYNAGGGIVYLSKGVYEITDSIKIGSNTVLTGDKNAIIRVSKDSKQFFTDGNGLIDQIDSSPSNIEIYGFQIDGNLDELPRSYANSGPGDHNAERAIDLRGSTDEFMDNISIHDMEIYDCYSDAIHIQFAEAVTCNNNLVSNCQHSGIFFVNVRYGVMINNRVAGVTSDCARLDNCVKCIVCYNVFYSFTGDSNGANQKGQNGLQISDQGFSHGGGSDKPDSTEDIEVYGNTFADCGRNSVWLDSTGKGVKNVYIHDNKFIDVPEVTTDGKAVSIDNLPTKETSKEVFDSIFDILNLEYIDNALDLKQGTIIPEIKWEEKKKAAAYICLAGYEGQINISNHTYIPESPWKCAKVLTDTRNIADKPAGQTSELKLSEGPNNGLRVELKVKTKFKTKVQKSVTILGKKVSYEDYVIKSKTETFKRDFPAPAVFPVVSEKDLNISVRYFNNTYNPHTTITIEPKEGTVDVFRAITYNYNGSKATDEKYLGHVSRLNNGFKVVNYEDTTEWTSNDGLITYRFQGCFIPGSFNPELLSIDIDTPYNKFTITHFDIEVIEDPTISLPRKLLVLFLVLVFLGLFVVTNFKMLLISFGGIR